MPRFARLLIVSLPLLSVSMAAGQTVWNQLLSSETTPLPGASSLPGYQPAEIVRSNGFRELRVLPNGNFAGSVTTNLTVPFGSEAWYLYGSGDRGVTVGALRREGDYDGQTQTSFGSPIGIDSSGSVLYGAALASAGSPVSLWRDDVMLFAEGDAITNGPLTGSFYDRFSWPTLTPDGVTRWTSDYAATSGGPVIGGALFSDSTAQDVLLKTGDSVAAGLTIDAGFLSSNLAWSQLGSNYLTSASVVASEEVVILNGQAVSVAGGGLLRENDPIPAQAGGLANETWALGSLYEVNEAGDWASSASVRLAGEFNTAADLIVVNGVIRYRDGDVIDGHTLSGLPSDISLNDRGDVAFVWDNKVFLNDRIIAQVGDSVDTNGDGAGDVVINNLFDVDLTNLPSAEGDGSPLLYLGARVTGSREAILRNTPVTLTGDYNGDGVVNAADYTVWRDTEGTSLLLGADGDGDNTVDTADYGVWSAAYGTSVAPSIAIPEPLAVALLAALLTPLACRR